MTSARAKHWQNLDTASPYIEDYVIQLTTKEEAVMRAMRNEHGGGRHPGRELQGRMGSGPGRDQRPLRRSAGDGRPPRHPEERLQGDRRAAQGKAITFMAKYNYRLAGSSSHIHNSLWSADGKTPLFFDKKANWTLSAARPAMGRRPAQIRPGVHLVPGALHQFLQALPGRHLRADQDHVERGQPHRRLPPVRRGHARVSASNAASAAPTSTRISPLPR